MTFTSEERREVADSLLARAVGVGLAYHDVYALNDGWVYRTLHEIVEAIGCTENPHPAEWMARLAGLIDPTCQVSYVETYDGELGQLEGWEFHLTCGHSFQQPWNEPPAYCPECGARVVDDD